METQSPRERSWIYFTACVILALMVVWAVIVFSSARETTQAQEKADELIAALEDAGARDPRQGPDRARARRRRRRHLRQPERRAEPGHPAARCSRTAPPVPGARPVIADSRVVQGQLLIIEIYCPDELEDFQEFVDDLKTDDVAGELSHGPATSASPT